MGRWSALLCMMSTSSTLLNCSGAGNGHSPGGQTPESQASSVETSEANLEDELGLPTPAPDVIATSEWGFAASGTTDSQELVIYTDPGALPRLRKAGDGESAKQLPLEHTHVKAQLTGFIAEVEVRQSYTNPFPEPIEAVYIFPLPENSAVNHMRMEIGDRVIESQIKRRQEARQIYTEARREGYTAALLEQERPNIFTQSVANIEPGKQIDVVVRYVQDLTYDAGEYEFVFPMVVGPRYIAGQPVEEPPSGEGTYRDTQNVPDASRITPPYLGRGDRSGHDISLELVADASLAVNGFETPTHEVVSETRDDGTLSLQLAEHDSIPNRDFVLRYRAVREEPQATLFLSGESPEHEGGFFSLVIHPPSLDIEELVGRRELIFVIDVSGSMSGVPLSLCKTAVREAITQIRPVDTFNIIVFSGRTGQAFEGPRPANTDNIRQALEYVDGLSAGGGTEIMNAVNAALESDVAPGRHRYVFFLTDGNVGIEDQVYSAIDRLIQTLEQRGQQARIFSFGVGSSVNRELLEGMSRAGRGIAIYATNREHPRRAVNQFYRYIDRSVLREVSVDWGSLEQSDVMPSELPDLFASHAMILHGRYRQPATGTLMVTGRAGDREVSFPVTIRNAEVEGEPSEVLGALWARSRVTDLEESLWHNRDPSVDEQITQLGLSFNLVTRLTSLVAVDRSHRVGQGDPQTVVQAVEVPEGVDGTMAGARGYASYGGGGVSPSDDAPAPCENEIAARRGPRGCHCRAEGGNAGGDGLVFCIALVLMVLAGRSRIRRA